jgi:mono/diheme cytochrome c family protein
MRRTLGVVLCTLPLAATFVAGAAQSRSVTEGVYSAAQAERGQEVYRLQCNECHGNALQGGSGPPLTGERFISNWSGRPLLELVDKIQNTMPFGKPGTVSRAQAVDLSAYILQSGKFPSVQTELSGDRLAQIAFPGERKLATPVAAAASAAVTLSPPEGNLAQLMRAIAFPNSNIIFNVQVKDPNVPTKRDVGPDFDYVAWGTGVYTGWLPVEQAAIAIIETAPLFLTPGRRCQNGLPVPVDRPDWKRYTTELMEIGRIAKEAAIARKLDAFEEISEKLSDACANCHRVYRRDAPGAMRCQ